MKIFSCQVTFSRYTVASYFLKITSTCGSQVDHIWITSRFFCGSVGQMGQQVWPTFNPEVWWSDIPMYIIIKYSATYITITFIRSWIGTRHLYCISKNIDSEFNLANGDRVKIVKLSYAINDPFLYYKHGFLYVQYSKSPTKVLPTAFFEQTAKNNVHQ